MKMARSLGREAKQLARKENEAARELERVQRRVGVAERTYEKELACLAGASSCVGWGSDGQMSVPFRFSRQPIMRRRAELVV